MEELLAVEQLSYTYPDGDQQRIILNQLHATFTSGTFYTILGSSGSGKTTLLSLLSGLDTPKTGTIRFQGQDIKEIGYPFYRKTKVGIVFQNYNLIPYLTAIENILLAMSITNTHLSKEALDIARNLLDYIGISQDKADRLVTHLSGGNNNELQLPEPYLQM